MNKYLKNIDYAAVLDMADLVPYQDGHIVSRTLVQTGALSITLFGFDTGEQISAHESKGDALITVLDGKAEINIGDKAFSLEKGQSLVMPSGIPHAVFAPEKLKMLLIVVFPH